MKIRLQKILAEAGAASRRGSESLIAEGRVSVNGEVVRTLGAKADPVHDRVSLDGKLLRSRRRTYLAFHKPAGCVCSRSDPQGRRCLHDFLPQDWSHLFSVGRLDWNSEGLIFLTNDGEFCLRLTHPRYGVRKTYVATIEGRVPPEVIRRLLGGIDDHGERLVAQKARLLSASNNQSVVELELTEGKNREVRRLFEAQNLMVRRLVRTRIGPIKLAELPAGKWRTLTGAEIKSLLGPV